MASLMEELIDCLEKEADEYEQLLSLSQKKTPIIVKGETAALEKITDEEQIIVSRITNLDVRREAVTKDIANVINKDVDTLKLSTLIELLSNQPAERKRLSNVHDRLSSVVHDIKIINDNNAQLIKHSLEMVEFDLNMIQAMRQAPETANYSKGATNTGEVLGQMSGSFDAKQ